MSAPGRGQDVAARARAAAASTACAPACSRATCRAASTPTGSPALHVPGDAAQHRPRLRRRVPPRRQHGPLRAARAAARRDRPARDRERRQPRLPGRVPGRRGRAGDGLLGHRGRGQAAQVPADVPHLRARGGQQDRPARRTSTSTSSCFLHNLDAVNPGVERMLVSARTGEGVDGFARLAGRWRRRRRARGALDRARRPARRAARAAHRGEPRASSTPRRSRSRGCATGWPSASRAAGGCVALGASPAARSDVRHVAVEFVHPVIVGKRALPAIGARRARAGRCAARSSCVAEPDDIVIAFGPRTGATGALAVARARARLPDDRLRAGAAPSGSSRPPTERSVRRARSSSRPPTTCSGSSCTSSSSTAACSRAATRAPVHDTGASSFLYPFLAEREHDLDAVRRRRARARC